MNRPAFLSLPAARRLAFAAPAAAGLALAAAVIPAGVASAAPAALPANCTQVGSTVTCTYGYTGAEQTFAVPSGVSSVQVTAVGAPGATGGDPVFDPYVPSVFGGAAGLGGTASATVTTHASTLYVEVGGLGNGTAGGWNGGGGAGMAILDPYDSYGGGGGGASDVRTTSCGSGCATGGSTDSLGSRLVVAAGGGGGGGVGVSGTGGAAGAAGGPGSQGQPGRYPGGGGGGAGTTTQGGAGGAAAPFTAGLPGIPGPVAGGQGTSGQGGAGGNAAEDGDGGGGGGGAGSGYYGGGGGGGGNVSAGGGGGGGFSYAPGGSTGADTTGTPSVTIIYIAPSNTVTVTSPGNQAGTAGTAVSLPIQSSDSAAGQALTYSATGLPAGLSISSGGLISGTLTNPGSSNVTVTATDATGASGSASFTWTVNPAATTTVVTSSAHPSVAGQPVTLTATVSTNSPGPGTPTGTVTFTDGSTTLGTATLSGGQAQVSTSSLAVGAHTITATYGGDANFTGSSGSVTQQVAYKIQPLYDPAKAYNSGAALPVKIQLLNAAGANVSAAGITVTVTGLSPSPAPGKAPVGTFTYQMLDQEPGYQLNVKTTGYPAGTYTLSFTISGDPTAHTAQFVIG